MNLATWLRICCVAGIVGCLLLGCNSEKKKAEERGRAVQKTLEKVEGEVEQIQEQINRKQSKLND